MLPGGIAVDASGKLYVSNNQLEPPGSFSSPPESILVFDTAHENTLLATIMGHGLYYPGALAIDAAGKLYVANAIPVAGFLPDDGNVLVFDTVHGYAALPPVPITTGAASADVTVH